MKLGEPVKDFSTPPHPNGISLVGKRVSLKPLKATEFGHDLFEANALDKDGLNWTHLAYGPFRTESDYIGWVKSVEDGNDTVFFAIVSQKTGKAVGVASYLRIKKSAGSIEVGHINFSPLLQSTTEATEAMYLMMKWVFDHGYRRYEWKCNALNLRSRRAAQRLGFSYEGVFRQATIQKGRNRDTAWFAIIDKEWNAIAACFNEFLSPENFTDDGKPKVSLSSMTKPLLYKLDPLEGC